MNHKLIPALGAGILALGLLSGCSVGATSGHFAHEDKSSKPSSSSTPATSDNSVTDDKQAERTDLTFGTTYSFTFTADNSPYGDITVSAPRPFSPSAYAAGVTGATNVVVDITYKNTSSKPIILSPTVQAIAGGQQASDIFDTGNGLVDAPYGVTLTPGTSVTWNAAFSVATTDGLQVQAQPDYSTPVAIFR